MLKISGFIIALLTLYSCITRQEKPVLAVQAAKSEPSIIALGNENTMQALTSINEIKTVLLNELRSHQSDTSYQHFTALHDTVNGSFYQAEIAIGGLFHPTIKSAVLGWSINDTMMDIEVLDLDEAGEWKSIFVAKNQPSFRSGTAIGFEFLYFKDYNHDGWQDLEVVIDAWDGIGTGHRSKLWLVNKSTFTPVQHFEDINSPELDVANRQICSYLSGGCADMAMYFSTWQLKDYTVKMTKEIGVDCCVGSNGNCLITIDNQKSIPIPGNKVHLYVPEFYRARLRDKMRG